MNALKLIGTALVLLLVFGLAIPAFASPDGSSNGPSISSDHPGHDLTEDTDEDMNEVENEVENEAKEHLDDVSEAEVENESGDL